MANFATLDSLKKNENEDGGSNTYYAGGARGSGHGGSGLNVIGPPPDDDEGSARGAPGDGDVREIFRRAETRSPLGTGGDSASPARTITMYNGGFTIDDGPLRRLDDPANKKFLSDLAKGQVPRELADSATPGQSIDVRLVDKQNENYVAPAYVAYGGAGQTMGPSAVNEGAVMTAEGSPDAAEVPQVDEAKPHTKLQIRLHTGKCVRVTLNMHHTVRHVHAIIASERAGDSAYILMAGYPPAPLTDASQTLEEARLRGASIVQKLA